MYWSKVLSPVMISALTVMPGVMGRAPGTEPT